MKFLIKAMALAFLAPNLILADDSNITFCLNDACKRDGVFRTYYDDGRLESESFYKDNRPYGVSKTYSYDNGKLETEIIYEDEGGIADSEYYPNGRLQEQKYYKKNLASRLEKKYYESGELKSTGFYKKGKEDGIHIGYYPNGSIYHEISYKDGKVVYEKLYTRSFKLVWQTYQLNKDNIKNTHYENINLADAKNGNRYIITKTYYESGALKKEEIFLIGYYSSLVSICNRCEPHIDLSDEELYNALIEEQPSWGSSGGIARYYYENGGLKAEIPYTYKYGTKNGIERQYYENGKLKAEILYKHDKLANKTKRYYENGSLESITPYKNSTVEGTKLIYHKNGKLESSIPYKDGKADGIGKVYDIHGKLSYEVRFKNGKKIKIK